MSIVYSNKYFCIKNKKDYFYLELSGNQVIILPVIKNTDKFLMIKAKRFLHNKSMYEFPSGGCNKKEKNLLAAKREFQEETGIKLLKKNKIFKLPGIYQMANRLKKPVYAFFVVLDRDQVNLNNYDKNEVQSLHLFTIKKIISLIKLGKLNSAVPITLWLSYLIKENKIKII